MRTPVLSHIKRSCEERELRSPEKHNDHRPDSLAHASLDSVDEMLHGNAHGRIVLPKLTTSEIRFASASPNAGNEMNSAVGGGEHEAAKSTAGVFEEAIDGTSGLLHIRARLRRSGLQRGHHRGLREPLPLIDRRDKTACQLLQMIRIDSNGVFINAIMRNS